MAEPAPRDRDAAAERHGAVPEDSDSPGQGGPREESVGSLLLRGASVVPFVMLGVMAVIAVVAWVLVFVFGLGLEEGPVWDWAEGRSGWEVISQVGLALLAGLVPVGVLVLSMLATSYGVRERQAAWFWPLTQVVFMAVVLLLVALDQYRPGALADAGISGRDWWLIFGWAAYAVVMSGLRMRAARRDKGRRPT
jgi:hypothetical protein